MNKGLPVKKLMPFFLLMCFRVAVIAQPGSAKTNPKVTDIWVVFKTHFDLGFTDLPENVFRRYREEMMDNALSVIEKSQTQPKEKRFA